MTTVTAMHVCFEGQQNEHLLQCNVKPDYGAFRRIEAGEAENRCERMLGEYP